MSPLYRKNLFQKTNTGFPICKSSPEESEPSEDRRTSPEKSPAIPDGFLVEHILEFLERYPAARVPQSPRTEFSQAY
jgi:hypothetical protein